MKMSKTLQNFLEKSKKTDSYWVEKAKLDFSLSLEKRRVLGKMSYAAIAKKIGTSAAYITKIFRGDSNLTIETMVKLARATGGELDIQLVDSAPEIARWNVARGASPNHHSVHLINSATVYTFPVVSNSDSFEDRRLAQAA